VISGVSTISFSPQDGLRAPDHNRDCVDDFTIGKENRVAAMAVHSLLGDAPDTHNPLVLCGASGTGKSHLARGIAEHWRRHGRGVTLYNAATFARQLTDATEAQSLDTWRRDNRRSQLFVLEDLDLLRGKPSAQDELVRTIDAVLRRRGQLLLTCRTLVDPSEPLIVTLRGRLEAGLVVRLDSPGLFARRRLLRRMAVARQVSLSADAARVLAIGLDTTAPQLSGWLQQLQFAADQRGTTISAEDCQALVQQVNRRATPSLRQISTKTAKYFDITTTTLKSSSRARAVVLARSVAMYLSRRSTEKTLLQIGAHFGGRDHTTVLYNCRKTEKLLRTDAELQEAIDKITSTWS